jgi:hypothetical protein
LRLTAYYCRRLSLSEELPVSFGSKLFVYSAGGYHAGRNAGAVALKVILVVGLATRFLAVVGFKFASNFSLTNSSTDMPSASSSSDKDPFSLDMVEKPKKCRSSVQYFYSSSVSLCLSCCYIYLSLPLCTFCCWGINCSTSVCLSRFILCLASASPGIDLESILSLFMVAR